MRAGTLQGSWRVPAARSCTAGPLGPLVAFLTFHEALYLKQRLYLLHDLVFVPAPVPGELVVHPEPLAASCGSDELLEVVVAPCRHPGPGPADEHGVELRELLGSMEQ